MQHLITSLTEDKDKLIPAGAVVAIDAIQTSRIIKTRGTLTLVNILRTILIRVSRQTRAVVVTNKILT